MPNFTHLSPYNYFSIIGRNPEDQDSIKLVVDTLKARYTKAMANPPGKRLDPKKKLNAWVRGFADRDEWLGAVKNPRYSTSSAYRTEVVRRLKASKGI